MANSADPDQMASTLFAKAGYIRVQQDKGKINQFEKMTQENLILCIQLY